MTTTTRVSAFGALMDDLGPACTDLRCGWVSVPHVHEDDAVYPLPPDRPEWIAALAADEEADRVEAS